VLVDIFTAYLDESISLEGILVSKWARLRKRVHSQVRLDSQTMFTKTLAGLALMVATSQTALAAEWQYCLAPSHTEHKIYMSAPFSSSEARASPDSALEKMLIQSGVKHDDVQCPRANDESSIVVMRQETIRFNRAAGNEIVDLNWKP
jgi:hypothetical protein